MDNLIPGTVRPLDDLVYVHALACAGAIIGVDPEHPDPSTGTPVVLVDVAGVLTGSRAGDAVEVRLMLPVAAAESLVEQLTTTLSHVTGENVQIATPEDRWLVDEPYGVRMLSTQDGEYSRGQLGVATHRQPSKIPGHLTILYVRFSAAGDPHVGGWVLESETTRDNLAKDALS